MLSDECHRLLDEQSGSAHQPEERWRGARRDNFFAGSGIITLRYGWADVTEIARVLRQRGWTGHPTRCHPVCDARASGSSNAAPPEAQPSAS